MFPKLISKLKGQHPESIPPSCKYPHDFFTRVYLCLIIVMKSAVYKKVKNYFGLSRLWLLAGKIMSSL